MTKPNPHAGRSLIEIIWEELDEVMLRLMMDGVPDAWTNVGAGKAALTSVKEWGEERGQAQGLAYALAVLTNPYHVDVDAIRAEALKRYKEKHEDD